MATKESQSLDKFVTGLVDGRLNSYLNGVNASVNFRFFILFGLLFALGAFTLSLSEKVDRLENQPRPVPSPVLPVEPQSN